VILLLAPHFIWWMSPVIVGMLLAVPFTVLTSRSDLGLALRSRGWLLTPEKPRSRRNWPRPKRRASVHPSLRAPSSRWRYRRAHLVDGRRGAGVPEHANTSTAARRQLRMIATPE